MKDIAWMPDDFFDSVIEFMMAQKAFKNSDDFDENMLYRTFEEVFTDINNKSLYRPNMTPAQFCWRFLEEKAHEAMESTRCKRDGRAGKILIAIRPIRTEDGALCLEYHSRLMRALSVAMDYKNLSYDPVFMTVGYRLKDGSTNDAAADFLRERGAQRIVHQYDVGPGLGVDWLACTEFAVDEFYDDVVIVCSPEEYMESYYSCVLKNIIPKHEMVAYREHSAQTTLAMNGFMEFFEEGPLVAHRKIATTIFS